MSYSRPIFKTGTDYDICLIHSMYVENRWFGILFNTFRWSTTTSSCSRREKDSKESPSKLNYFQQTDLPWIVLRQVECGDPVVKIISPNFPKREQLRGINSDKFPTGWTSYIVSVLILFKGKIHHLNMSFSSIQSLHCVDFFSDKALS